MLQVYTGIILRYDLQSFYRGTYIWHSIKWTQQNKTVQQIKIYFSI